MKIKKIAIADDATAYGEGIANEVEKTLKAAGVQVVAREKATDKTTDFKAILTKMKGKAPDAIFYGGMDATGGPMIKQARELGIKSVFSFGDGACTEEMAKLAGAAAEGLICSQAGLPASAASQSFNDAFKAKYGEVKQYAPFFYDAVGIMIAAMQKADSTDPAKFVPEISKIKYNGATGVIEFDEKGDRKNAEITIFTLKDGKVVPVGVVKAGKASTYDDFMKEMKMAAAPAAAPRRRRRRRPRRHRPRRPRRRKRPRSKRRRQKTAPSGAVFFARAHRACRRGYNRPHVGRPTGRLKGSRPGHLPAADHQRAHARQRVRHRGAGLHDGVRHHPAHQFRARRSRDDRRDGRVHGHRRADQREHRACPRSSSCSPACWPRFPCAWRSATRWSASRTGRCAARRGSPR